MVAERSSSSWCFLVADKQRGGESPPPTGVEGEFIYIVRQKNIKTNTNKLN